MAIYNKKEVQRRLRQLRETQGLSMLDMGRKLDDLIGRNGKCKEGKGLSLWYNSGSQAVSQLENGGRTLLPHFAVAYAKIFDVSLDYIYGLTDEPNTQYSNFKEFIGLSDKAMQALIVLKDEIVNHSDNK